MMHYFMTVSLGKWLLNREVTFLVLKESKSLNKLY